MIATDVPKAFQASLVRPNPTLPLGRWTDDSHPHETSAEASPSSDLRKLFRGCMAGTMKTLWALQRKGTIDLQRILPVSFSQWAGPALSLSHPSRAFGTCPEQVSHFTSQSGPLGLSWGLSFPCHSGPSCQSCHRLIHW